MKKTRSSACPDCAAEVNRREFVGQSLGMLTAVSAASMLPGQLLPGRLQAAPSAESPAETAVKELYAALTADQKKIVALPFDDARRTRISANWHVTAETIGKFFTKPQQELIRRVVQGVTSVDGFERFEKQMADDSGGFENYSIAIFGDPAAGQFQFELTGRHLTLRADGDTLPGAAFGGPIVYGHGKAGNSAENLFKFQTSRANEVFQALDPDQRTKALLDAAPSESAVQLRKDTAEIPGISVGQLAKDQQELVGKVLQDILSPYREQDVDEVMAIVKANGGLEQLRLAFYKSGDLGEDQIWDIWRVEGPSLVCHFRGAPHVHAYINVAQRA